MDTSTANTYGFPPGTVIPQSANFGVSRLDVLNNELSSGYYSSTGDIAALTREISRVSSGMTGDMNVSSGSTGASTPWYLGGASNSSSPSDTSWFMGGAPNSGSASASSGIVDSIKKFFTDSSVTIASVVIGIVLLIGAFFIYRR